MAARERKQPLKIINVQQMNSPVYLQQMVGDFEDEPIRQALKEGKLPLFFDELLQPEAGLARELGLDYACLAIVANWAAGAGPDVDEVITLQDVLDNVAVAMGGVPPLLEALLAR